MLSKNLVTFYHKVQHNSLKILNTSFIIYAKRNTSHQKEYSSSSNNKRQRNTYLAIFALSSFGITSYYFLKRKNVRYSYHQVARHGWTTYAGGVYDLKEYATEHPGGEDAIISLAGKALDPCWEEFAFHNNEEINELLERMKIGHLKDGGPHSARCKVIKNIPKVNIDNYRLELIADEKTLNTLKMEDLKSYPKHSVVSSIPCKRKSKTIKEIGPTWSGARLSDVLSDLDIKNSNYYRIQFECLDTSKPGKPYGFDLSLEQALDPNFDVLLAYEMNGADLPPEHGYPLRLVISQLAGKRNIKWLNKIILIKDDLDQKSVNEI